MIMHLRKFDMASVPSDSVVVVIGKRATGKSFVVRDLLHRHRDVPIGCVVSLTESVQPFYQHFIPPALIHTEYTPEVVDILVDRQMALRQARHDDVAAIDDTVGGSHVDPRAFLVLDNCLMDSSWTRDERIRRLFMNDRSLRLLFVITIPHPLGIPPILLAEIDYIFILRETNLSTRKRTYQHYANVFPTFDVFCQVMDQCTDDYGCLVIDNTARSIQLEDRVFWYKAPTHGEFRMTGMSRVHQLVDLANQGFGLM